MTPNVPTPELWQDLWRLLHDLVLFSAGSIAASLLLLLALGVVPSLEATGEGPRWLRAAGLVAGAVGAILLAGSAIALWQGLATTGAVVQAIYPRFLI
jgi:hypothetical protein